MVFIPKACGSGNDKMILGQPIISDGKSVCSQTYVYASFDTIEEANNFVSYLKTKFFRILVSSRKITQDALSGVYQFVPKVSFDQPWTDKLLFEKFKINSIEQDYIDSMIKEMS